jgi:uncharacterized membrane protein (UPF0127 family)
MQRTFITIAVGCLAISLAGCGEKASTMDDLTSLDVTLPNGVKVACEVMRYEVDIKRHLMFHDPLPPGRGMMLVYAKEGRYPNWMYQVKFPIDTIWIDKNRVIVEIIANLPACDQKPSNECPTYGGNYVARYALEVPAGFSVKNGLKPGKTLDF